MSVQDNTSKENEPLLGFIGQGFIGKNYADDFERRGYSVIRYAKEAPYHENSERITECDIVFVAVPTPTTPDGFDDSILREAIAYAGAGSTVVIKSTIVPGTTRQLQEQFSQYTILYSPEFLSEATAAHDAANPFANIVGMPRDAEAHQQAAHRVQTILPEAPYTLTCSSTEAEVIKYTHNGSGYTQIIFFNMMYDYAQALGCDWDNIQEAIMHDPMINNRYGRPVHKSGRGAGGHCFIKDWTALKEAYHHALGDALGDRVFSAMENKNISLLQATQKDLDILRGVYGETRLEEEKNRQK